MKIGAVRSQADEILQVTDGYRKMAGFSLQQLHDRPSLADMHY